MLSALNNLKIQQKLTITFGAIALAIVAMGGCVFWGINGLEKVRSDVVETAAVQNAARAAQLHIARQDAALSAYVINRSPEALQKVNGHRESFNSSLDNIKSLEPSFAAQVEQARAGVDKWFESVAVNGVGLSDTADYNSAAMLEPVNEILKTLVSSQSSKVRELAEHQQGLTTMVRVTMVVGTSLALLIAVLSGLWLTKGLAQPLVSVTTAMRRLVNGDTSVQVVGVGRKDEVGMMASTVEHFKLTTQEKQQAEAHSAQLQKQAEEQRAALDKQRASDDHQDAIAISAISEGLEHLAQGDLTWRISVDVWEKAQILKDNFNTAVERLETAVSVVNTNVAAIHSGVGEISSASDDLSRRTEQQAATLEETAAALEEITVTVTRTAEGAREAARVVTGARSDAELSGQVVTNAVSAMNAIETSSNRIGTVIGVIDEIAFQTNLLALNAGVEAARAGDAGRGFAVVASEVRALAQRSADAAKEIKTLISASSQQVGQGVTLVGQTGEALQRIVDHVSQIDGLVNEIAASAQEQATGLSQVNSAVTQMDQVTQQNAAMVEESTAAAHSLAGEAETLSSSVAHFRVSQKAVSQAPARPAQRAYTPSFKDVAPKAPVAVAASLAARPAPAAPKLAQPSAQSTARNVVNDMRAKLAQAVSEDPIMSAPAAPAKPMRPANEAVQTQERPRSVAETVAALKTSGLGGAALKSQPIEDGWEEF